MRSLFEKAHNVGPPIWRTQHLYERVEAYVSQFTLAQPYVCIEHELDQLRRDSQHFPYGTLTEVVQWLEQRKQTVPCDRPAILHRDDHPWNVLIDATERAWGIDWDWQIGDACFDLAWMLVLMRRSGFDSFSTAVHAQYVKQRALARRVGVLRGSDHGSLAIECHICGGVLSHATCCNGGLPKIPG